MTSQSEPGLTLIRASERIETVDVLRGFALLGILCINILAFAYPSSPPGFLERDPVNQALYGLIVVFVESKFFTLFSALFGLGFAIQLFSAQRRGADFAARFRRRLLGLGAFGALHILLFWDGDILLLYAIVGLFLLAFRRLEPPHLLVWIRWLLALPLGLYTLGFLALLILGNTPALRDANTDLVRILRDGALEVTQKYASSDYVPLLVERVQNYSTSFALLVTRIPTVLAMFLIGLYVGRTGILARPLEHTALLRRVRTWGWGVGLPLSVLIAVAYSTLPPIQAIVALLFNQALAGPLLSLGYASTWTLFLARGQIAWTHAIANVGRAALSTYLSQSLFCTLIFNGYGLGLAGKLAPSTVLLIALGIYAVQIVLSTLWLQHFRFGPTEWLWRSITYGAWQPMRLERAI